MIFFRADVVSTGTNESIADDFIGWVDTTNNIDVGGESLQVEGVKECPSHNCSGVIVDVALPGPYYYWITGVITGIIFVLVAVVVITVALLWYRWRIQITRTQ